jgi:hypothetical protein
MAPEHARIAICLDKFFNPSPEEVMLWESEEVLHKCITCLSVCLCVCVCVCVPKESEATCRDRPVGIQAFTV